MTSPFVEALRAFARRLEIMPTTRPAEAVASRRVVRDLDEFVAGLEGRERGRDLVSSICHDLKDPLASIVMGTVYLQRTAQLDPAARRVVDAVARSTERMSQVVKEFHDLSHLESGGITLDVHVHDVVPLLREAVEPFAVVARQRGIALDVEVPDGPLLVPCDRRWFVQVAGYLVGHAVRSTPDKGRATLMARAEERAVRVEVAGTGPGCTAEDLKVIFDHSAKGRRTRAGAGLGLAIARAGVELQGGTIEARRNTGREGHGTTIAFTLPRG